MTKEEGGAQKKIQVQSSTLCFQFITYLKGKFQTHS